MDFPTNSLKQIPNFLLLHSSVFFRWPTSFCSSFQWLAAIGTSVSSPIRFPIDQQLTQRIFNSLFTFCPPYFQFHPTIICFHSRFQEIKPMLNRKSEQHASRAPTNSDVIHSLTLLMCVVHFATNDMTL